MKFQLCFCFKRNRASYNLSSKPISNSNDVPMTPTVTLPPVSLSSDLSVKSNDENVLESSDDRQLETSNKHVTFRQSPPIICEDDAELYAKVDKTKQAKNSIRIHADTQSSPSITNDDSQQVVHFRNVRISQQRPRSLPHLNNTIPQTKVDGYESISDFQDTCYDRPKSVSFRDEYSSREISQRRSHSFVYGQRDTIDGSELYAEIGNDSASGVLNRVRRPYVSTWRPIDDDMADNASGSYATIEELGNSKKIQSKRRLLFRRH